MTPALERLVDDASPTADGILAATDDLGDIAGAAGRVFADVVRLNDAAKKAMAESDASDAAQQRAIAAMETLRQAWNRYEPWREALDILEAAIAISLRGSLGRGKTWPTAT